MTFTVPRINMTTGKSIEIPASQSLVQVLLQQDKRHVEIEQENMEKAATELADKFGAELGFDKVVAAKILGETRRSLYRLLAEDDPASS